MTAGKVESASHVALVDPLEGAGVLVAPPVGHDLTLDGPVSLHHSDWDSIVRRLARADWTLLADDDDEPVKVAKLDHGESVYALHPALDELQGEPTTPDEDERYFSAVLAMIEAHELGD